MNHTLPFASDYMEGCHPNILRRLSETNHQPSAGYGLDDISDSARKRIRKACAAPQAEVKFLVGGTQTNATVIDCVLRPYEGVIAADSGHVNVHEAGAIEFGAFAGAILAGLLAHSLGYPETFLLGALAVGGAAASFPLLEARGGPQGEDFPVPLP